MFNQYQIQGNNLIITHSPFAFQFFLVKDEEEERDLKFHVESDDYFVTLAASLSLMRQIVLKKTNELGVIQKKYEKMLEKIERDLVFLNKDYKIIKK